MKFKGKDIKVVLSEEATEEYNELNRIVGDELQRGVTSSVHQSIFRSVERVKRWLKENPFAGEQVQKSLIPDYYLKKYGITNLWRIDLSDYWRLVYTIQSNEVEIIDFVLTLLNIKSMIKSLVTKENNTPLTTTHSGWCQCFST